MDQLYVQNGIWRFPKRERSSVALHNWNKGVLDRSDPILTHYSTIPRAQQKSEGHRNLLISMYYISNSESSDGFIS